MYVVWYISLVTIMLTIDIVTLFLSRIYDIIIPASHRAGVLQVELLLSPCFEVEEGVSILIPKETGH